MWFSFWRIWEYFILSKEVYYWWSNKITIAYTSFYIIIISVLVYLSNEYININDLVQKSSQELINAFTLISGFMLTWITIMLATWKIENLEKLMINYDTNESWVINIIEKLKKILFYEILFQFIIIILINLLIAWIKWLNIKENYIINIFLVLIFISLIMTYRLVNNFIAFENIIWFKFENTNKN